jgi:hypothetical protein
VGSSSSSELMECRWVVVVVVVSSHQAHKLIQICKLLITVLSLSALGS